MWSLRSLCCLITAPLCGKASSQFVIFTWECFVKASPGTNRKLEGGRRKSCCSFECAPPLESSGVQWCFPLLKLILTNVGNVLSLIFVQIHHETAAAPRGKAFIGTILGFLPRRSLRRLWEDSCLSLHYYWLGPCLLFGLLYLFYQNHDFYEIYMICRNYNMQHTDMNYFVVDDW